MPRARTQAARDRQREWEHQKTRAAIGRDHAREHKARQNIEMIETAEIFERRGLEWRPGSDE